MKAQVDLPLPSVWIVKAKISLYILIKQESQGYPKGILSFPLAVQTDGQTVLQPFSAVLNKKNSAAVVACTIFNQSITATKLQFLDCKLDDFLAHYCRY